MSKFAGDISKKIREQKGWSQAELAERLHLSRNYVALIETGAKTPSVRLLVQLEQLLTAVENENKIQQEPLVEEPKAGPYSSGSVAQLLSEIDILYTTLLKQAGNDVGRLGWFREELKVLAIRARYNLTPEERQRAEADLDRLSLAAEDAESVRAHSAQSRRHA